MPKHPLSACRLYGFVDTAYLAKRDPADVTHELIDGGVDIIQVRAKKEKQSKRIEIAAAVVRAAEKSPVPVIVNDDLEAALKAGADGVHLGQEDWDAIPASDRLARLLGIEVLGISTHSLKQARDAQGHGASYIGVGPVHATATKPGRPAVGLDLVRQVTGRVDIPFFAIGGITLDNVDTVIAAGATRIAVVSAILAAPDVTKAAAEFKKRLP